MNIFETFKPEGFTNVNTYLFVEHPKELETFLKTVFDAEEMSRTMNPDNGDIANLILKIGDTCIMLSQARGQFLGMSTCLYLYVNDVDAVHKKALEAGAKELFGAADMNYGDRQSGIQDPAGNYWWISERLTKTNY